MPAASSFPSRSRPAAAFRRPGGATGSHQYEQPCDSPDARDDERRRQARIRDDGRPDERPNKRRHEHCDLMTRREASTKNALSDPEPSTRVSNEVRGWLVAN